jgi:putative DNA primase/helicase
MITQHSGASSATLRRASKQSLAFIEDLPENQQPFYKEVASVLRSQYVVSKEGIGFKGTGTVTPPPFCGPFRVTAVVQELNPDRWSRVIEFVNFNGDLVEYVLPNGKLDGKTRDAIAMLSTSGLRIFEEVAFKVIPRIIRNWPEPKRQVLMKKVGWTIDHDAFITPSGGVITRNNETPQYHFAGDIDGKDAGDLKAWREGVAALAVGNTNLVFAIALGFSTALLPFTDLASIIFHLFGQTSKGKTRVLRAGLTVWPKIGENDKTWSATINGLEGEVARSNHILFGLDELPKDAPAELGNMIYTIANSAGKVRGEKDGSAKKRATWNTFVISTGEHSMISTLSKLGKITSGGQGVRMLDIPVDGSYGAFDYLHGHATSDAFVRALDAAIRDASGPAGAAFVQKLIRIPLEDLLGSLEKESEGQALALQAHCGVIAGDEKTTEIRRVLDAFALIAVAGEMATEFGLTGWTQGMASDAIKTIAQRWLDGRGTMALDKRESIRLISDYLTENELRFVPIDEAKPVLSDQEWAPGFQDEEYFYVLQSTMSKIYVEKSKLPVSLSHLVEEDYLFKGGEKGSMQFRVKQIGQHRPRAYRIKRSILDFNASIDNASATARETLKGQE